MGKTRYFVIFVILTSFTIPSLVDEAFSIGVSSSDPDKIKFEICTEEPSNNDCVSSIPEDPIIISNPINGDNPVIENNNHNNRCLGDCTKPTFYKDKFGEPVVQNGFIFNNNATDVTGYHTPYPLITINTNQTYNMKLKVYENIQLKWFQIGFGMPEIGKPFNDAESLATFYVNYNDTLDRIVKTDKYSLIDIINATVNLVPCGYDDLKCYELSTDFVARDQLKNNIIAIQAVDMARYSATHYINDGIEIVGESLNEPLESKVAVSKGGAFYPQKRGTVELTLIDYKTDTWKDPYGYLWTSDNHKSFKIVDTITPPTKEPDKLVQMLDYEEQRAMKYFDSSKLKSIPQNTWNPSIRLPDS